MLWHERMLVLESKVQNGYCEPPQIAVHVLCGTSLASPSSHFETSPESFTLLPPQPTTPASTSVASQPGSGWVTSGFAPESSPASPLSTAPPQATTAGAARAASMARRKRSESERACMVVPQCTSRTSAKRGISPRIVACQIVPRPIARSRILAGVRETCRSPRGDRAAPGGPRPRRWWLASRRRAPGARRR